METFKNQKAPDSQPVLVAIDFSDESKAALLYANKLAAFQKSSLVLLHVVHGNENDVYRGQQKKRSPKLPLLPIHEVAEYEMQDFISVVQQEQENGEFDSLNSAETMVVDGLPVTRILEVARNINAGHIIVGGNQRGRLSRMLNGSVSKSLAQESKITVTVFRTKEE